MSRRAVVAGLGALLGIGLVVGALHYVSTAAPSKLAATAAVPKSSGYGMATPLDDLSDTELNKRLDDMQSMGVTWVRYDVNWSIVQQDGPNSYNWSNIDRIAKGVHAHKMHSLMILDFTPPWARASSCHSQMCAPANVDDFGRFAAIAAQRYQPDGVNAWEIWNEPNMDLFFRPSVNIPIYTKLLKSSYTHIKQVQPNSTVLVAGPAPRATSGNELSQVDFIKAIYAAGAHGYFDAIADHPYSYPSLPTNQDGSDTNWGRLKVIHDYMASHQDGSKQIWITEYGDPTGGATPTDHNTEPQQAAMLAAAITAFHADPWAGPFFWFNYQDKSDTGSSNENYFGLLRADGSHKPAYDTYRQLIAKYRS